MGKVIEITSRQQLDQVLEGKGVRVIDIYADWCSPCKFLAPKLEELATMYPNVAFFKLNSDTNLYPNLSGVPTVEVYNDGKLVKSVVGVNLVAVVTAIETCSESHPSPPKPKKDSAYRSLGSYNIGSD